MPKSTPPDLQELIDGLDSAILIEDADGTAVAINQKFTEVFAVPGGPDGIVGLSRHDIQLLGVMGRPLFLDLDNYVQDVVRAAESPVGSRGDELRLRDGRILERDCIPLGDPPGSAGRLWQHRDVTEERRIAAALERTTSLLRELAQVHRTVKDGPLGFELFQRLLGIAVAHAGCVGGFLVELDRGGDDKAEPDLRLLAWATTAEDADAGPDLEARYDALRADNRERFDTVSFDEAGHPGFDAIIEAVLAARRAVPLDGRRTVTSPLGPGRDGWWTGIPLLDEGQVVGVMALAGESACPDLSVETWLSPLLAATIAGMAARRAALERSRVAAELAANEAYTRAVFESALDGIVTIDQQAVVLDFNGAVERIFGWTREDAIGRNMADLMVPPERRAGLVHGVGMYLQDSGPGILGQRFELPAIRVDGSEVPVEVAVVRMPGPGAPVFTVFVRDISDRWAAHAALVAARDAAQDASRAKDQFLAMVSHEIRTPLNAILGLNDLARSAAVDAEQAELLDSVRTNALGLKHLLNDLLDFARIEAGQLSLDLSPVSITEVLDDLCQTLAVAAERNQLELRLVAGDDLPPWLQGDRGRIRQVLMNLAWNALKFTQSGHVELRAAVQFQDEQQVWVRFEVEDTGPGISADELEHVFNRFYRADTSATRKAGGAGLGLSICRALVDLMGGSVHVRSTVGEGSTFTVDLPFERVDPSQVNLREPDTEVPPEREQDQPWVLLVEDNPDNARYVELVLKKSKHRVFSCADGVEGLAALAERRFDLVLTDIDMPRLDGLEMTRRYRALEAAEGRDPVPVLALTAHAVRDMAARCREAGMQAVVTKPFGKKTLLQALARHMDAPQVVLVAEDSQDLRRLVRRFLAALPVEVIEVADGDAALEVTRQRRVSLILLDMNLPGRDGWSTAAELQADPLTCDIPVIAMTGETDADLLAKALEAGCSVVLQKPFTRAKLVKRVRAYLPKPAASAQPTAATASEGVDADIAPLQPGYLSTCRASLPRLRSLLSEGRLDAIAWVGHDLKGSGAAFGFDEISAVGARLEAAARAEDSDRVESIIDDFEQRLHAIDRRV